VVGLWGIGFFSFDLIGSVLDKTFREQGLDPAVIEGRKTLWVGIASLLQNAGAFLGIYAFTHITARTGRRPAFAITFVAAMAVTAFTFWNLNDFNDIFWMIPLMGFCQLALFGGYAIYLPELFPTRLRSTGTSFCYNVGRFLAAVAILYTATIKTMASRGAETSEEKIEAFRTATSWMSAIFLLGLVALLFLPETKARPLPEATDVPNEPNEPDGAPVPKPV